MKHVSIIRAANGSVASCDVERTRLAYAGMDGAAEDCTCAGCRNYRTAWKLEYFTADLLGACVEAGIDPSKALEISALCNRGALLLYMGELPFFGQILNNSLTRPSPGDWTLGDWTLLEGCAGFGPFASTQPSIQFTVEIPWELAEANIYDQC